MDARHGTLERAGDRWRLRFVRELAHSPEKVWRALTEADHLAAWFPGRIEGAWRAGERLRFVEDGPPPVSFDGEVIAVDPPRVLEYLWGDDRLRFELEPSSAGTTLTMLDTFAEHGKAARDAAGWHVCLDRFRRELDDTSGQQAVPDGVIAWQEVHPEYVELLGPDASTIGPPEGHPVLDSDR